jgi:adenylate cyclase
MRLTTLGSPETRSPRAPLGPGSLQPTIHRPFTTRPRSSASLWRLAAEIERKFLVPRRSSGLEGCRFDDIEQGYLAADAESEVRVRRIGKGSRLTVKRGSGRERLEEEIEITDDQFEALWRATEGRRLAKRRYYVPLDDLTAEVDVYGGKLDGLITAEVEFDSVEDSEGFDPPDWFGVEITDDPRYANQALAEGGKPPEGD